MIATALEESMPGRVHIVDQQKLDGSCFRIQAFCARVFNTDTIDHVVSLGEFRKGDHWCEHCVADYLVRGGTL